MISDDDKFPSCVKPPFFSIIQIQQQGSEGLSTSIGIFRTGTLRPTEKELQSVVEDGEDDRDPVLVEAYYKVNVNEFFSFTPAIIYADNDSDGDTSNVYGAVRASFSF